MANFLNTRLFSVDINSMKFCISGHPWEYIFSSQIFIAYVTLRVWDRRGCLELIYGSVKDTLIGCSEKWGRSAVCKHIPPLTIYRETARRRKFVKINIPIIDCHPRNSGSFLCSRKVNSDVGTGWRSGQAAYPTTPMNGHNGLFNNLNTSYVKLKPNLGVLFTFWS